MALNIKKLLVSQPKPASEKSPYFDIAEKYGVEIDFRPFIKVEPLSSKEFRQQKISILDHTAVVFTARTAIDHFFHLCEELRVAIPETMKYFCMTEAIAVYLQKYIAIKSTLMANYIRFDWAMKRLLRNKANFGVLEGLLTTLLDEKITISQLLESESNQEYEFDKYNRVDLLALDSKGELILIEVQNNNEYAYFKRMLFGVSNLVRKKINGGGG